MRAYKKDTICNDFDIVMQGINNSITDKMKIIALEMFESLPDNQGRDLAISNLLYTAQFVKAAMVLRSVKCP